LGLAHVYDNSWDHHHLTHFVALEVSHRNGDFISHNLELETSLRHLICFDLLLVIHRHSIVLIHTSCLDLVENSGNSTLKLNQMNLNLNLQER
jgi:hypothetical protein